jgi:molybdenum-dependent DNA-binding transcriptional regulator ModE
MAVRKDVRRQDPRDFDRDGRLNARGFHRLRQLVVKLGSIQAAATEMGLSGQTAWRYATGIRTPPRR